MTQRSIKFGVDRMVSPHALTPDELVVPPRLKLGQLAIELRNGRSRQQPEGPGGCATGWRKSH